jgi:hypothetical protein
MNREFQNGIKVTCSRHAGVHAEKGECRDTRYVAPIGRHRGRETTVTVTDYIPRH